MYKLIILSLLFILLSCSNTTEKTNNIHDLHQQKLSFVSIYFNKNGRLTEDLLFAIYDTLDGIKFLQNSIDNKILFYKHSLGVNTSTYSQFLKELRSIELIKDSLLLQKSGISIKIYENDSLVKNYNFNNLSQISMYLSISNRIFGSKNYMPFKYCLHELE